MRYPILPLVCVLALGSQAAFAQDLDAVKSALLLPQVIEVMREEGVKAAELMPSDYGLRHAPKAWEDALNEIYDLPRMMAEFDAAFEAAIPQDQAARVLPLLQSAPVQSAIAAEMAAREAMLDAEFESEAIELSAVALADQEPQMLSIRDYIRSADLVERNVASGLNNNIAFYAGLNAGLGEGQSFDEQVEVLRGQTDAFRLTAAEWLHAYMFTAYLSLEEAERGAYFAFMTSPDGAALSEGVMQALEVVFDRISYDLGYAVGQTLFGVVL